jgi:hypothetical protein
MIHKKHYYSREGRFSHSLAFHSQATRYPSGHWVVVTRRVLENEHGTFLSDPSVTECGDEEQARDKLFSIAVDEHIYNKPSLIPG